MQRFMADSRRLPGVIGLEIKKKFHENWRKSPRTEEEEKGLGVNHVRETSVKLLF